jgi:DHA2 family multidrug resistance protein
LPEDPTFLRFAILSTSYVIPQYVTTVQNYRAIQIGGVLLWIALPQFVLAPIIATILRFIDARWLIAVGFALIGLACFMASRLTQDWAGDNFLLSQLVQTGRSVLGVDRVRMVRIETP